MYIPIPEESSITRQWIGLTRLASIKVKDAAGTARLVTPRDMEQPYFQISLLKVLPFATGVRETSIKDLKAVSNPPSPMVGRLVQFFMKSLPYRVQASKGQTGKVKLCQQVKEARDVSW